MSSGMFGKVLDVDLSKDKITEYPISEADLRKHLGGRGIAAKIMLNEFKGGDALSPDNLLIFMTGPLNGLSLAGSGRHVVMSKSPLTGFLGEGYSGGFFGTEIKRTGLDGILIRGKANHPKFLSIVDGNPELEDAKFLWGNTVGETHDWLNKKYKNSRVACIGPAGEKLVKIACVINDRNRAAGRCGHGAVMGSKNLKAIVVRRTQGLEIPVMDVKRYREARRRFVKTLDKTIKWGRYGTSGITAPLSDLGVLPTKNYQQGSYAEVEKITGSTLYDTILERRASCTACPIRCKREVSTTSLYEDVIPEYGGPEYETIAAFGSLQLIDDLSFIALANQKCNTYGLDTIGTGNVIAYAMEATERGLIKGPEGIAWGSTEGVSKLLDKIAYREGIGDKLAEGVKCFAETIGGEEFAIHTKGMEAPMHEPRGKKGLGLDYATSYRGCTHLEGLHDTAIEKDNAAVELGVMKTISRFSTSKRKVEFVLNYNNARSFINSLVLCHFVVNTFRGYVEENWIEIRDILDAVTGYEIDRDKMLKIGERNYNLGRLFSIKQGLTRDDDDLPPRFKNEALPFGDQEEKIPQEVLDQMIADYYELRGWDENGIPTPEKLKELGIEWAR
ncbi:MAG: aldehyde ferredoxin oxidoreductase family protein [Candidatus Heimdallarchaeota archaeon]